MYCFFTENPTSGGLNLTIISPLQHDNFTFVNTSGNNITSTNKETPPNNTTTNNITLSNTTSAPPSDVNTTLSDVTTDYDNVTVNVTFCRPGYGYPEFCPRPSDPVTFTKCCRYYMEPRCCEERARKVCASRNRGMDYVSAFDIGKYHDMNGFLKNKRKRGGGYRYGGPIFPVKFEKRPC